MKAKNNSAISFKLEKNNEYQIEMAKPSSARDPIRAQPNIFVSSRPF